ncbi:trypsin-like peptidase domain-containing protein [Candidatus Saccharibacteria bacterium]|nr:trypsin-like peptidase domain-containing protein [Candidatus Saccharibacteria bacterium]
MTEMAVREHNFGSYPQAKTPQPETRMERRLQQKLQRERNANFGKKALSAVVGAAIGCMPMAGVVYAKHAQREAQRPYEPLPPCMAVGRSSSLDLTQPETVAQRSPVGIAEALGDRESLEQQKHEALQAVQHSIVKIEAHSHNMAEAGSMDITGSGYIIAMSDGTPIVMTAAHVVSNKYTIRQTDITFRTTDGQTHEIQKGCHNGEAPPEGQWSSGMPDVAALRPRDELPGSSPLHFATDEEIAAATQAGQPFFAVGFPANAPVEWGQPIAMPQVDVLLPAGQRGANGKMAMISGLERSAKDANDVNGLDDAVLPGMSGGVVVVRTPSGEMKVVGMVQAVAQPATAAELSAYGIVDDPETVRAYEPRIAYLGSLTEIQEASTSLQAEDEWSATRVIMYLGAVFHED